MDQVQTINIIENDTATQSIRSALSNAPLNPSNLNSDPKDVEDSNCNITVICQSYDNTQAQDILFNGNHSDLVASKISERHQSTECLEPNKCIHKPSCCKNCDHTHNVHDSSHFKTSPQQPKSIAPIVTNGPMKSITKLKSLPPQVKSEVQEKHERNKSSSESINGRNLQNESILESNDNGTNYKNCVKNKTSNVNNNNTELCSSQQTNANLPHSDNLSPETECLVEGLCSLVGACNILTAHKSELKSEASSCSNSQSQHSECMRVTDDYECNMVNVLGTDEILGGIKYVSYKSELQMPDIIKLIQKDLSEPYSIYTYRYFIHNWPKFCFLAMDDDKCVGAIVCKLDIHRKVIRRGYIAMLAVDENYRKRKIGSNLVLKAIRAMVADEADEVVLETEITNRPALKLYENLGFVRDKRLFRYYLNGVDALRLKLWLR
uniref:N-terminal methionine N(alpha)-acetyltransferase NatC n=1 Tax=Cacopsylla melanoneura TaxID=428564 RepID=A0A8D8XFG4_9HEMI